LRYTRASSDEGIDRPSCSDTRCAKLIASSCEKAPKFTCGIPVKLADTVPTRRMLRQVRSDSSRSICLPADRGICSYSSSIRSVDWSGVTGNAAANKSVSRRCGSARTISTPPGNCGLSFSAAITASAVLPEPYGPVIATRRFRVNARCSHMSSFVRPTKSSRNSGLSGSSGRLNSHSI
jgi:hypothetical protein